MENEPNAGAPTGTAGGDPLEGVRTRLIEAALPYVVFDGWSRETLERAAADTGTDMAEAHLAFPRGGPDMALGFHYLMDDRLRRELATADLGMMRIRERIAFAVRRRVELVAADRDAVRRAATLLALPHHAAEGAAAIWNTADVIWTACGDTSEDYNWYSKRAILASVYSSTVLYWLGDESPGFTETWGFLDRRIENVMQFEKLKAGVQRNPVARAALWLPGRMLGMIRPPHARGRGDREPRGTEGPFRA